MTRWLLVIFGAVLVGIGCVFFLQGLNVLKGSEMSDQVTWAVIGPLVALVGLAMIAWAVRRHGEP